MDIVGFEKHDHTSCIDALIAWAETVCRENNLQFTPGRRRVLEILAEEHKAMGAYDILERLAQEGRGSQPPVAYRALDFLVRHGFAHKIEHLNAYIACAHPRDCHMPAFLICRACDTVAETIWTPRRGGFAQTARSTGFNIEHTVVEATGLCPQCDVEHRA
ncbi:transcriptional repressor [Pontibaca salina]|uniref:Transcriptional repressor n=1 Tax=Pontibaca salina TaxID=2795731 RepID=A0A934HUR7_9RHOB|nr:transcriptional repressor [Pontibaca salina]MBI6629919.1 transcriptional repressor [Pontibaca salina]